MKRALLVVDVQNEFSKAGKPAVPNPARARLFVLATLFLAFETGACGGGSDPNRVLQSIAVTPPTADAENFLPNGQVQFSATGTFSKSPSSTSFPFGNPYGGSWQLSQAVQPIATITQDGLAQCKPGASGTVTVEALAEPGTCHGTQCTSTVVVGDATLSCP